MTSQCIRQVNRNNNNLWAYSTHWHCRQRPYWLIQRPVPVPVPTGMGTGRVDILLYLQSPNDETGSQQKDRQCTDLTSQLSSRIVVADPISVKNRSRHFSILLLLVLITPTYMLIQRHNALIQTQLQIVWASNKPHILYVDSVTLCQWYWDPEDNAYWLNWLRLLCCVYC